MRTPLIERLRRLLRRSTPPPAPSAPPEEIKGGDKLVVSFELFVDARCPCGSPHIHHLTLYNTSECARCGRRLGVRSIEYVRSMPSLRPDANISVGYVQTDEALLRRQTRGVH